MRVPVFGGNGRGRCLIHEVKILLGDMGGRRPSGPAGRLEGGGWPSRWISSANCGQEEMEEQGGDERFKGDVHPRPACRFASEQDTGVVWDTLSEQHCIEQERDGGDGGDGGGGGGMKVR